MSILGQPPSQLKNIGGWLAVLGSAFFFYLATLIIRWSEPHVEIDTAYFVFARFLLGIFVVLVTMGIAKQRLHPRRYHFLIGRTVANCIAVFCFYKSVEVGSVVEANILNMTYPLFVTLFSWLFYKKQRDKGALLIVIVAFIGIWFVLSPGEITIRWENVWGLSSGISAAAAILYLNISRKYHDSQTILFFMFGLGALFMFCFFHDKIFWPNGEEFFFLLLCSVSGVLGQYLLTYGFLFVTAVEGSIISSSRILMAAILGPVLAADPHLTLVGWCGALLLFMTNVVLAMRKQTEKKC